MSTLQDLKYKYNALDIFGKIIAINVILFALVFLLKILKLGAVVGFFMLPSSFGDFILQPWSIITYGFLHSDIWHLLFNMLMLFYLSRLAANLFRNKMVLNIFFMGIICGALLYLGIIKISCNYSFVLAFLFMGKD